MGRKSKETSLEIREVIIFHWESGKSIREIGNIVCRSYSTVRYIIKRYEEEGRIINKAGRGRKKILNSSEERFVVREVKENPKISAPKINTSLKNFSEKEVSDETVRRVLRKNGYNGRVARRKPYVSEINRKKRVEFAKKYITKPPEFWNNVIFCDESKFNIWGSDGHQKVWRKSNAEMDLKNLCSTVKHGGGHVMVWGCISYHGVGKLQMIEATMDKVMYMDILKKNLKPSAEVMGISEVFHFYQDNDPKHKSRLVQEWLLYNCPKIMQTPPQSPDLNPIEMVWNMLDTKIRKHSITNKKELQSRLQEEWPKIDKKYLETLVESMPKRLAEVIRQKGYPTKY